VGVEVNQAGRDDEAGDVPNVRAGVAAEVVADPGDLAAGEGDVRDAVEPLRGVDYPPAL
jgi:hypothetical protein